MDLKWCQRKISFPPLPRLIVGGIFVGWVFEELLTTLVARTSTDGNSPNSPPFLLSNQRYVLLFKAMVLASHSSSQMLRLHSRSLQFPVQQYRKFLFEL
jgi:hypothetical protein